MPHTFRADRAKDEWFFLSQQRPHHIAKVYKILINVIKSFQKQSHLPRYARILLVLYSTREIMWSGVAETNINHNECLDLFQH